jgi:helix-turn-helix protein
MSSVIADFTARVAVETRDWAEGETARVLLNEAALVLATGEADTLSIPLAAVVDFDRQDRTIEGSNRPVIVVTHVSDGTALTTVAATESTREFSILGRFLRGEYQTVIEALSELSLSESETEMLTMLYSAGDMDISLPSVLDTDPKRVKRILHALHEKGLIESGENGPVLTARGRIVVNEYLERVNT